MSPLLTSLGGRTTKVSAVPDFFTEFLPYVRIESDNKLKPGPTRFEPWDFQKENFALWLEGKNTVWLKRRQIGASWMMAMYAFWTAAYHEYAHVGVISIGQREADEFNRKIRFIGMTLPDHLKRDFKGERHIKFESSGSQILAFPSTEFAGTSFMFRLLIVDEAAMHPYGQRNYNMYEPTISAGGQLLLTSTANPLLGPSGFFYDMWVSTTEGENDYHVIFNGRYCRPGQDEAWFERTRARFKGSQEAFDANYPETPAQAFVGRQGLVFPTFSRQWHVRTSDPLKWGDYLYRVAGIDPGGGDPTAMVVYGVYKDRQTGDIRWHQPKGGEFYKIGQVGIEEMVNWLSQWEDLTRVYIDTAGGLILLSTLRQYGFNAFAAQKDREIGLGMYAELVDQRRITHHASNENTIQEYFQYRWLEKTDPNDKSRYRTSTPVDNHADAKDATRYAIVGLTKQLFRSAGKSRKLKVVV